MNCYAGERLPVGQYKSLLLDATGEHYSSMGSVQQWLNTQEQEGRKIFSQKSTISPTRPLI